MDAEARLARKVTAKDGKYSLRYRPKQVGRSVFTIQQIQAKRAEQVQGGRVEKPSRSHVSCRVCYSLPLSRLATR